MRAVIIDSGEMMVSRIMLCFVLFVIFSGAQSIAGIVAETKSVTGEPGVTGGTLR
jgi:hypothetical protein